MDGLPGIARFRADLIAGARRDRVLYAIALMVLVAGFAMQPVTGNRPDWAIVLTLGGRMLLIGGAVAAALLAWRLAWLAVAARSRTPARDLRAGAHRSAGATGSPPTPRTPWRSSSSSPPGSRC